MFRDFFIFLVLLSFSLANKQLYTNYGLYKIIPQNVNDIQLLGDLQYEGIYDFWNDPLPKTKSVSVLSHPDDKLYLENWLKDNKISFEVISSNIQNEINKEKFGKYTKGSTRDMNWEEYFNLEQIYSWLDDLIDEHPVATEIIGATSYENRQIKGVKISHGNGKKAIFVEGTIHSREFISTATVTYILNELLHSNNEDIQDIAREFDWYIFPVTNPDGYIHSFEENRLWRKNRRPFTNGVGVDLNRNWNDNWLLNGSSTDTTSDLFAGYGPFSEPESRGLSTFMTTIPHIEMYLSFHSYGQELLLPFGNTTEPLANYDDAKAIGERAMEVLAQRYGTEYVTGNIVEIILTGASGGSIDWVKERLKVPLVFCYELRDKSSFILPPEQILPNNEEVMDSVVELIQEGRRHGYFKNSSSKLYVPMFILALLVFVNVSLR